MAHRDETMSVWECDACGRRFVMEEADLAPGFHGDCFVVTEGGATGDFHWFACREAHIKQAVLAAVERGYNDS